MSYLTLSQVVNSYISQHSRPQGEFRRLFDIAIRGFKFCELHATSVPDTQELDVLSNKTAYLPTDCLAVISCGYQDFDGSIIPMTRNDSMTLLNSTETDRATAFESGDDSETVTRIETGSKIQLGYSYKVDTVNGRIIFDYNFPEDTVVVECMVMFSEQSEDYVVHPYFEEALISFIEWKDSKGNAKTKSERLLNRADFFEDFRIANQSLSSFSLTELFESYRREQSLGRTRI